MKGLWWSGKELDPPAPPTPTLRKAVLQPCIPEELGKAGVAARRLRLIVLLPIRKLTCLPFPWLQGCSRTDHRAGREIEGWKGGVGAPRLVNHTLNASSLRIECSVGGTRAFAHSVLECGGSGQTKADPLANESLAGPSAALP